MLARPLGTHHFPDCSDEHTDISKSLYYSIDICTAKNVSEYHKLKILLQMFNNFPTFPGLLTVVQCTYGKSLVQI